MTLVRLPYVDRFRDRHGKLRFYFRRGHGSRICLPDHPGSPEFMAAYQAALKTTSSPQFVLKKRDGPGTFYRVTKDYFESPEFLRLSDGSQRSYRGVIERLVEEEKIGHRLLAEMTRTHVDRMIAKRASRPGLANHALQKLRILMKFAINRGWRSDDPTNGIRKFPLGSIHTWTDEEIAKFENWWPIGTAPRTAFALLLYTGQRVSDVVRMVWADLEGGRIPIVQQKTKAKLSIPIHRELQLALFAWPKRHVTIIFSKSGKPYSTTSFSPWMARKIDEARLPERCLPHGLRKAAARLLAESGCSVKEIQAITGHASLSEIERYTKAADQTRLADAAFSRWAEHKKYGGSQT